MPQRYSRREFVLQSLGWTALVVVGCRGRGGTTGGEVVAGDLTSPIDLAPDYSLVTKPGELPFYREFTGDNWLRPHDLLLDPDKSSAKLPGGRLPDAGEKASVVVIGSGIAGLSTAYLLRDLKPIVLEQAPRFGGNAKGERWRQSSYAIGAAYFIQPKEGDKFHRLYREIGILGSVRKLEVPDPVEFQGKIYRKFFDGEAAPGAEAIFQAYHKKMKYHADEAYPDIPIVDESGRKLVMDLDRRSLQDVVGEWCGGKVPEALRAALQNYCYSSMGCGWQEVSAAGAINFLAGEEFGVLVAPGGNAALAKALRDGIVSSGAGPGLRAGCLAFRVERTPGGVRVAYADATGGIQVISARAAVLACPKFVAKHILVDMESDREKAIDELEWRGYMVVNVLLDRGIEDDFYDMYLLHDGAVVESGKVSTRATDVIRGSWAAHPNDPKDHSVLTLYWPLPYTSARGEILHRDDAWDFLRPQVEKQVLDVCSLLGVGVADVKQVRMTRWGHAVPVSRIGFIANGCAEAVRRPIDGKIFFVNQDNWALPAVETALQEAFTFAPEVRAAVS
jgi:hypothetical protein